MLVIPRIPVVPPLQDSSRTQRTRPPEKPNRQTLSAGAAAEHEHGQTLPAQDDLARVPGPETGDVSVVQEVADECSVCEEHEGDTEDHEGGNVGGDELGGKFVGPELDGGVGDAQVDEYPGYEGDCFAGTRRVDKPVDELPA